MTEPVKLPKLEIRPLILGHHSIRGAGDTPLTESQAAEVLRRVECFPEWLPIKTAPKDGTTVLIGWQCEDKERTWATKAAWWEEDSAQEDLPGWTDWACRSFGYEEVNVYQPTHWQPLPAALSRASEEKQ